MKKEEMIKFISDAISRNDNVTVYSVSKETNITQSAIAKIVNGKTKNPHTLTVKALYDYLSEPKYKIDRRQYVDWIFSSSAMEFGLIRQMKNDLKKGGEYVIMAEDLLGYTAYIPRNLLVNPPENTPTSVRSDECKFVLPKENKDD